MDYVVSGHCRRCGSPMYKFSSLGKANSLPVSKSPPLNHYTCECFSHQGVQSINTGKTALNHENSGEKEEFHIKNNNLQDKIDLQELNRLLLAHVLHLESTVSQLTLSVEKLVTEVSLLKGNRRPGKKQKENKVV